MARYVMNGNEQNIFTIGETFPNHSTVKRDDCTIYSHGNQTAFLLTMMSDGKIVITRFPRKLVAVVIEMYPEMKKYVATDGHIYFHLNRFVYGLAEVSRAFI
jgi:hypothetical protein